jgi:hypothetical protein
MNNDTKVLRFAHSLQKRMDELEIDIKGLADKTESTYEHIRKIVRGQAFPSRYFLRILCHALDLNVDEMDELLVADRLESKFGGIPAKLAGKDPTMLPLERIWGRLTRPQQDLILAQMLSFEQTNRRAS